MARGSGEVGSKPSATAGGTVGLTHAEFCVASLVTRHRGRGCTCVILRPPHPFNRVPLCEHPGPPSPWAFRSVFSASHAMRVCACSVRPGPAVAGREV